MRTNPSAVRALLTKQGGSVHRPVDAVPGHLTAAEREEVSRGIAARLSSRAIAARIGHSPPTASREIARNGGRRRYRATIADDAAWERARRPKPSRLARCPELRRLVRERLEQDWSPEQIAVWLKREHPKDASMRVSHETIYRSIYLSGRHELGPKPARHLRSGRMVRHARRAKQSHGGGVLGSWDYPAGNSR